MPTLKSRKPPARPCRKFFEEHGEQYFRDGERRVIDRLLHETPRVLATGGGAYMSEATRTAIADKAISVWLKADFELLMKRVRKRSNRPLLQTDDPEAVMRNLINERYPVYAGSDIMVESKDVPHDQIVAACIDPGQSLASERDGQRMSLNKSAADATRAEVSVDLAEPTPSATEFATGCSPTPDAPSRLCWRVRSLQS